MKKKSRKSLITILAFIFLILVIVLAALILFGKNEKKLDEDIKITEEEGFSALNFETPYITLKYPEEWKDSMYVEEEHDKESGAYTFIIYFKGEEGGEAEMARVYFGQEDKGLYIGAVSVEEEEVPITMEFGMLEGDEWTEDDRLNYGIMQEDMNEMIYCMAEGEDFIAE